MRRPLAAALSTMIALLVGAAGLAAPVEAAPGPAATVTTVTMAPATAAIGDTVTLTATVTAAGDPVPVGYVSFDAAPTEETLWGADTWDPPYPDPSDVALGSVAVDASGVAALSITLTTSTIAFLRAGTPLFLAAEYQPFELGGAGLYDTDYATSTSAALPVTGPSPQAPPLTATSLAIAGPAEAQIGTGTTWTATVAPTNVAGRVLFLVDNASVGSATVVAGTATFAHTFTKAGAAGVSAVFVPTEESAYARSFAQQRVTVAQYVPAISISGRGSVGDGGTLPAAGMAFAILSIQLPVGTIAATPTVELDGAAVKPFGSAPTWLVELPSNFAFGPHSLAVHYASPDPQVASADASFTLYVGQKTSTTIAMEAAGTSENRRVRLTARVTSEDGTTPAGDIQFKVSDTSGGHGIGAAVPVVNGTATGVYPLESFKTTFLNAVGYGLPFAEFVPAGFEQNGSKSWFGGSVSLLAWRSPEQTAAQVITSTATVVASTTAASIISTVVGAAINGDSATGVLRSTTTSKAWSRQASSVKVACPATESGYSCDFGLQPAGTYQVTIAVPVAPGAAGTTVPVTTTVIATDPTTGEATTVATGDADLDVPRRTVLVTGLAPAKGVTSVRRGAVAAYRLSLENAGIVDADGVKACVTVGAGATVRAAVGGRVRGRTACWTVAHLDAGRRTTRTLRFVAPATKGDLKFALAVTPRKSQAAPLRLSAVLPVR